MSVSREGDMFDVSEVIDGVSGRKEARDPIEHSLKSWPHLFEAVLSGAKKHEMRRASDRDFRIGDSLRLREYDPKAQVYTGRETRVRVTYVTSASFPCALSGDGLHPDYCILSISDLSVG